MRPVGASGDHPAMLPCVRRVSSLHRFFQFLAAPPRLYIHACSVFLASVSSFCLCFSAAAAFFASSSSCDARARSSRRSACAAGGGGR